MQQLKDVIPAALADLSQRPQLDPINTTASAKSIQFESFKTFDDPQLGRMLAAAELFAADMAWRCTEPRWLTLLGSSGAGKTMLARAITKVFKRHLYGTVEQETPRRVVRYRGGFVTWHSLVAHLRERDFRVFDDCCNDQFVALDDIASEYASEFTRSKLSEWCNRSLGKWRVITANISLGQISQILDPRIASRMLRGGSVVVEVDVKDYNAR